MNQLDPVNVAVALASIIFGPTLAAVLGPYAVIILASTVGAAWSLGRRDTSSKGGAAWYFLRLNTTAVIATVSIASLVHKWAGLDGEASWLLAPVAMMVGGIGDDWPKVFRWVWSRGLRLVERRNNGAL